MTAFAVANSTDTPNGHRTILVAGLVAGVLDLSSAFVTGSLAQACTCRALGAETLCLVHQDALDSYPFLDEFRRLAGKHCVRPTHD